jgi:hypothetical protein
MADTVSTLTSELARRVPENMQEQAFWLHHRAGSGQTNVAMPMTAALIGTCAR